MRSKRTQHEILNDLRPFAGGDGTDELPEDFRDEIERVGELNDEELSDLEGRLVEAVEAEAGDSDESLALMEALAQAVSKVRTESTQRAEAAEQRAAKREEILQSVKPAAEAEEETPEEEAAEETPAEEETTEETVETETEVVEEETPEAVAASVQTQKPKRPSPGQTTAGAPARHKPKPTKAAKSAALVAAGDVKGIGAGSEITVDQLAQGFVDKARGLSGTRAEGRYPVASMMVEYPQDRSLTASAAENAERVSAIVRSAQAQHAEAIVAAGGLCAPVGVRYEVDTISEASRPIRDSLARFQADRGGVQLAPALSIGDLTGAVDVWTQDNDEDAVSDANVRKAILRVDCPDFTTTELYAVTLGIEVGNFARMTNRERFQAFWETGQAAHARLAEQTLFSKIVSNSTAITFTDDLGATRTILHGIGLAVAAYKSRHRMSDGATLRAIFPSWVRSLIREDLVRQMPGDNAEAVADATIVEFFARRNVAVTWSPDLGVFDAQTAGTLDDWPTTFQAALFPEGTHLFLDGGSLDFGMDIRDSALNRKNDTQAFMETFEGTTRSGNQSLAITFTVCPSGTVSGTTDVLCGS